jgi:argininosuccinate lyase
MQTVGLDYRAAHRIVGQAVKAALAAGEKTISAEALEAACHKTLGRRTGLTPEAVAAALDPAAIVATRTGPGGAAEARVTEMIQECRDRLDDHEDWRDMAETRATGAEALLLMTAAAWKLAEPESGKAERGSLEDLFGDLPVPPNRKRWDELREE